MLDLEGFPASLRPRYRPVGVLGSGGMGTVYRARDTELGRDVAVKRMLRLSESDRVERFRREAEALARIEHPNLVRLYDHGEDRGTPYLLLELIEGDPLRTWAGTQDAPEPIEELLLEVADALEALHGAGVLHRDVKPGNVVVRDTGQPVLLDLGLVEDPQQTALTETGGIVGTMGYLAPEVLGGQASSPASDFFSWGVTAFEALEGRRPYSVHQLTARAMNPALTLEPPAMQRDVRLAPAVRAALSCDPDRRAASRRELEELATSSPPFAAAGERMAPARTSGAPGSAASGSDPAAHVRDPGRPSRTAARRLPALALGAAALAGVLAALLRVLPATDPTSAPTQVPTPSASPSVASRSTVATELQQRVQETLAPFLEVLRAPDGRVDPLGGRTYPRAVGPLMELFADARTPVRWQRLLDALEEWLRPPSKAHTQTVEELVEQIHAVVLAREVVSVEAALQPMMDRGLALFDLDPEATEASRSPEDELRAERARARLFETADATRAWVARLRGDLGKLSPAGQAVLALVGGQVWSDDPRALQEQVLSLPEPMPADPTHASWLDAQLGAPVLWDVSSSIDCETRREIWGVQRVALARRRVEGLRVRPRWAAQAMLHRLELLSKCPESVGSPEARGAEVLALSRAAEVVPAWVDLTVTWAYRYQGALQRVLSGGPRRDRRVFLERLGEIRARARARLDAGRR